jgi:hypothetical protein
MVVRWLVPLLLAAASPALAQDPAPAPAAPRPGRLKAGPFYVTPRLRLGTIGMDTNVFYTATDRRTDFTASGGPGLEIVLPVRSTRLTVDGSASYVYFLRTESQRKLAGGGRARLEGGGPGLQAGVEASWLRTYDRPGFEVDRRLVQDARALGADLTLNPAGRLAARISAVQRDVDVPEGQPFRGADLTRALSRREQSAGLGLRFHLTAKTSLLAEGNHQRDRFTLDDTRDADSNRFLGGLEVVSKTRLSGRAVGGLRLMRFPNLDREVRAPYADVSLIYHVGPRTRIGGHYSYELTYTAFQSLEATPTLRTQRYGGRLEKGLIGRVDLHVYGTRTLLRTDGAVLVALDDGQTVRVTRDDRILEGGANLGYRFPWGLRIGLGGSYTDRTSAFADLGVEGLLLGAVVTYTPD